MSYKNKNQEISSENTGNKITQEKEELEEIDEELHEVLESVPLEQRKVIEKTLMTFQMAEK